jgi:vanadium-dependent haloperoxidase-like protein
MRNLVQLTVAAAVLAAAASSVQADVITDWNLKTGQIVTDSKLGTPPAIRVMAVVQTAVHEAVDATQRRPASVDAAVAAAHRATLLALVPSQQAAIEQAYQGALAAIADGPHKAGGISAGERAAAAVLAARTDDNAGGPDSYRPHAAPGAYVPTAAPAATPWPRRKPWLMDSAAQFRPAAPPALTSDTWARDYNEIKAFGAKTGSQRSAEQTEIARFWEYSLPAIYHGVVRSVALAPGRDVARNARLFAAVAQAMDDAMISVFDAKYHYQFWRPVTAIRNGDADGHDATARDAAWTPLIENPMHPEYPSAHSILASAVGTLLKAEIGAAPVPVLSTASPSAAGATRRWSQVDDFVREVANARVYEGVHFRFSTEVGSAMGRQIGALAAARLLTSPQ